MSTIKASFLLVFIATFLFQASCQTSQVINKQLIDLEDSIRVAKFIKETSLCDKIKYVEENQGTFCKETGYSFLVLESISKESSKGLFITIATGGMKLSPSEKEADLQSQLDEIKVSSNCMDVKQKIKKGREQLKKS